MTVFELVATLTLSADKFKEALKGAREDSESEGEKIGGALSRIGSVASGGMKLAAGAIAGVGVAVAGLTTTVLKGTSALAEYGDNIDKESQKLGISAQAYQEWDAILQHTGGSVTNLKPALKTLSKEIVNNSDAFKQLGIAQEDLINQPVEDVLSSVITKLQGMPEGVERTRLATQLLGRSSVELGALLNTSAEETEEMRQRVHELGGVMSEEAVKSAAAYQDSLQDFQTGIEGLKRKLLTDFLPGITTVMNGLTDIIAGNTEQGRAALSDGVKSIIKTINIKLPEVISIVSGVLGDLLNAVAASIPALIKAIASAIPSLIQSVVDLVMTQLPTIIEAVMQVGTDLANAVPEIANKIAEALPSLIGTIIKGIVNSAPAFVEAVIGIFTAIPPMLMELVSGIIDELPSIVETIGAALSEALPIIIEAVAGMLTQLAESLPEFIDSLVTALPELIDTIISTLLTFLPQLMDAAVTLFMALIEALPVIIQALIFNLPQIIATIVGVLVDNIPTIIETGITILMAFIQGIMESLPSIVVAAVQVIISLASSILSMLPNIISVGIELLLAVISGILSAIPQLIANIPQIITAIVTGLRNGLSQIRNVGAQLLKGLWNGISDTVGWLWDRITGLGGQIISKIKGIFGIHSPSAVMRDEVGKYLGMGLGIGFEDNIPVRDMLHAAQGAVDEIADNISGFAVNGSLGIDEIDMKTAVSARKDDEEASYTFDDMVEAFKTALGGMTVELDDIEAGRFVRRTLEKAVYA